MRAQSFRGRSRRAAADTVRVNHAHVGLNHCLPLLSNVHKRFRNDCTCAISSLWRACILRLRPVNRVNLRTRGRQGAEEVIARAFVDLVKLIQIEVVEHRLIPRQRLLAREVTFNHRAAAAFNGLALCVGNRCRFSHPQTDSPARRIHLCS